MKLHRSRTGSRGAVMVEGVVILPVFVLFWAGADYLGQVYERRIASMRNYQQAAPLGGHYDGSAWDGHESIDHGTGGAILIGNARSLPISNVLAPDGTQWPHLTIPATVPLDFDGTDSTCYWEYSIYSGHAGTAEITSYGFKLPALEERGMMIANSQHHWQTADMYSWSPTAENPLPAPKFGPDLHNLEAYRSVVLP